MLHWSDVPQMFLKQKMFPKVKRSEIHQVISASAVDMEQQVHSCTFTAYFQDPLLYQRELLQPGRVVIKEVKHAFKMSVLLLFNANDTFQWLKGKAEGGKPELEVKEG